jgi:hypothetical protein
MWHVFMVGLRATAISSKKKKVLTFPVWCQAARLEWNSNLTANRLMSDKEEKVWTLLEEFLEFERKLETSFTS